VTLFNRAHFPFHYCGRLAAAFLSAVAWQEVVGLSAAFGALTTVGNVSPAPPTTGGNVAAIFYVGDTSYGSLQLTAGTAVNVTGGSSHIGDDAGVSGLVSITGFGSNFTTSSDILVGNRGTGSFSAAAQSRVTMTDDFLLGVEDGSKGDLFADGFGTVVDAGDDFVIGQGGVGIAQITGGANVFTDATTIGSAAGAEGTLTVTGNSSLWRQDGTMTIGDAGQGILQVLTQARLESTNGTIGNAASGAGTVTVSGVGSVWEVNGTLTVALSGQGTLSVVEGGKINTSGVAKIASQAGSEASALVSGSSSRWNVGTTLTVGEFGRGALRILGGGRVNSTNAIISDNATARGEVFVDGSNSIWEIAGTLDVSEPGEGSLTITGGALVTTTGVARVGANGELALGGGRLDVGASGGLTNNGLVRGGGRIGAAVTNAATGEMRVQGGNVLVLGGTLTNSGMVNVDVGELEVLTSVINNGDIAVSTGALRFQGTGLDNNSGAQLAITGGEVDVLGLIDNNVGAQIVVGGKATAVFHDVVTNNGQFHVLPGSDALMLENLNFAPTSLLGLQLGAADETDEFGQVEVGGSATLAGTLDVKLASGFAPTLGDSFRLLTASAGLSGTFATTTLPTLGGGLAWDVDYTSNALTLSVVSGGSSADFDGDGDVDSADLAKWKTGFGKAAGAEPIDGDADGDFDVDGNDYLVWQRQFGSGAPTSPAVGAVPEPATGAMTVAAALMAAACSRRRRG
jgi:T5SS/PEP-CTERM-associated repeat protein